MSKVVVSKKKVTKKKETPVKLVSSPVQKKLVAQAKKKAVPVVKKAPITLPAKKAPITKAITSVKKPVATKTTITKAITSVKKPVATKTTLVKKPVVKKTTPVKAPVVKKATPVKKPRKSSKKEPNPCNKQKEDLIRYALLQGVFADNSMTKVQICDALKLKNKRFDISKFPSLPEIPKSQLIPVSNKVIEYTVPTPPQRKESLKSYMKERAEETAYVNKFKEELKKLKKTTSSPSKFLKPMATSSNRIEAVKRDLLDNLEKMNSGYKIGDSVWETDTEDYIDEALGVLKLYMPHNEFVKYKKEFNKKWDVAVDNRLIIYDELGQHDYY